MLKCLSYKQPWASLVLWGEKHYETRSTNFTALAGRWHAIHASKTWNKQQDSLFDVEPFRSVLANHGVTRGQATLPVGVIIGAAFVATIGRTEDADVDDRERALGDYAFGRWASRITETLALDQPLPFSGRLGVFDLPVDVEREVLIRLQWHHGVLPDELTNAEVLDAAVNRARRLALLQQETDAALATLRGDTVADHRSPIERAIDKAVGRG